LSLDGARSAEAFIGLGGVIVGVGRQLNPKDGYGPGDWRGDSAISTIVNIAIAFVGIALIASAAIPFSRGSRSN
jgi:hypothetical protein